MRFALASDIWLMAGMMMAFIDHGQTLGRQVHTHDGHQCPALPGFKVGALGLGAVVGQGHLHKHQQQALGLRLRAGRAQQVVKVFDVHRRHAFLMYSDFSCMAPKPSILQSMS